MRKQRGIILSCVALLVVGVFAATSVVHAQPEKNATVEAGSITEVVELENPIKCTPKLDKNGKVLEQCDPKKGETNIQIVIGNIIKQLLTILGSVTLLVFVAGGFMWMTSGGRSDQIQKGAKTMAYAVIGLFIVFAAYALVNLLISVLKDDDGSGGAEKTNYCISASKGCVGVSTPTCTADVKLGQASGSLVGKGKKEGAAAFESKEACEATLKE